MPDTFTALMVDRRDGATMHELRTLSVDDLPEGEVLVAVDYSSLNYKDGLAITGRGKIIREFPAIPGVDLAGTVEASSAPEFAPGDPVLAFGQGIGERIWGGYAEKCRLSADHLTPIPDGLDAHTAMAVGTAGFTAMLSVMELERGGVGPGSELPVVVTGASGGVGSVAVASLAHLGYRVAAVTGRTGSHDYLRELGAAEIVDRASMELPPKPLEGQRWAGAIDTAGSTILARVLAETVYGGTVAACGLAAGHDLPTTVMPFILRGVRLQGVDSVMCPPERRTEVWARVARDLPRTTLERITETRPLSGIGAAAEDIVEGRIRGRVVVDVHA